MCLAALRLQVLNSEFDIEMHVADNSDDEIISGDIVEICSQFDANYYKCGGKSCYDSATKVAKKIEVDWLCFASSDCYYVPMFSMIMLEVAVRCKSDLVYCNMLYDPRLHGRGIYSVLETFPEFRWIDKGGFIIKAFRFKGFPPHELDWRDGALVESFVKKGYRLDKAKGVLVVHN